MAETKKRLDERTIGRIPVAASFASSSAGSDTYAITLTPAPTAYETGRMYIFKADVANTGAATLNVNALGAKTIKKDSTSDLANSDILAGSIITCIYDGTNMQAVSGLVNNVTSSTTYSTGYTYGETISQWDNLYFDETTSTLKKITSSSDTWDKWVGVADEAGINTDTGKRVIVGGIVANGTFANTAPTFQQLTGGFNTILGADIGATSNDRAFSQKYQNTGADTQINGGSIWLKKRGSPVGNVVIFIAIGDSSRPFLYNASQDTDAFAVYTTQITAASITTTSQEFTFSFSNIRIPAGAYVHLVVTTPFTSPSSTDNYIIDSSATNTVGFTTTLGGSPYLLWSGISTTLRSKLNTVSTSQSGNAIRLYDGAVNGSISTGSATMGFFNRTVGYVVNASSWCIDKTLKVPSLASQYFNFNNGVTLSSWSGNYNISTSIRPKIILSSIFGSTTVPTGPTTYIDIARNNYGGVFVAPSGPATPSSPQALFNVVVPHEKGFYAFVSGEKGQYISGGSSLYTSINRNYSYEIIK